MNCIFCQIVTGTLPSHRVWENETHVAFLSIFPNTEGVTVVIPKQHYSSYLFAQRQEVINEMMAAAKEVALLLDGAFDDVGRTAVVYEGFGVDHLHAKLFPLHGTNHLTEQWGQIQSTINTYFETYEGYVSSHNSVRACDYKLAALAKQLRD